MSLLTLVSFVNASCANFDFQAPQFVNVSDNFNVTFTSFDFSYDNASVDLTNFSLGIVSNTSLVFAQPWKTLISANDAVNPGLNVISVLVNKTDGSQCFESINVTVKGFSKPNITAQIQNLNSRFGMSFDQEFNIIINNTGNATAENLEYYLTTDNSGRINNTNPYSKVIGSLDNSTLIDDSLILNYLDSESSDTIYLVVDYEFNGISQEQVKVNFSYEVDPVPKITSANILSVNAGNNLNHQLTWDYSGSDSVNFSLISGPGVIDNETGLYTYNSAVAGNYEVVINVSTTNYSINETLYITVNTVSSGGGSSSGSSRTIRIEDEEVEDELTTNIKELKEDFISILGQDWTISENVMNLDNSDALRRIEILLNNVDSVDTLVEYNYYKSEIEDIKRKLITDVTFVLSKTNFVESSYSSLFLRDAQDMDVNSKLEIFKTYVYYYNNLPKIYTVFRRTVDTDDGEFIEVIPKEIARDASLIGGEFEVIEYDPIIKFSSSDYTYFIEGEINFNFIDDLEFSVITKSSDAVLIDEDLDFIDLNDTNETKKGSFFSKITGSFLSNLEINESGFFIGKRELDKQKAYTVFMIILVLVLATLILFLNAKETQVEKEYVQKYNISFWDKKNLVSKTIKKVKKHYDK